MFFILCTQNPEYYLPSGACILQDRLGLNKNMCEFILNTDGKGYKNLVVPNGGIKARYDSTAKEVKDSSGNIRTENILNNSDKIISLYLK